MNRLSVLPNRCEKTPEQNRTGRDGTGRRRGLPFCFVLFNNTLNNTGSVFGVRGFEFGVLRSKQGKCVADNRPPSLLHPLAM